MLPPLLYLSLYTEIAVFNKGAFYTDCILGRNINLSWLGIPLLGKSSFCYCLQDNFDYVWVTFGMGNRNGQIVVVPRLDGQVDVTSVCVGESKKSSISLIYFSFCHRLTLLCSQHSALEYLFTTLKQFDIGTPITIVKFNYVFDRPPIVSGAIYV